MWYRLNNIKADLSETEDKIFERVVEKFYGVKISDIRIVKKSLDARKKSWLFFVYAVEFFCDEELEIGGDLILIEKDDEIDFSKLKWNRNYRPVVVGSGPAGMLAGICLAEMGAKPIIIERGGDVDLRKNKVDEFWKSGRLDENSNVQFGEGGAGTFSDGKLMTGIKKDKFVAKVIKEFIENGAPLEIAYLAKPHIGTDNLVNMVRNIRKKIEKLGGEYRFLEKLVDVVVEDGKLCGVVIEKVGGAQYRIETDALYLGVGHSARDTFRMLFERGIEMKQKPFAVGCRIEHKQEDINLSQYGEKFCKSPYLGAADYKLAEHLNDDRTVYTFCMCPGGMVVGATNLEGHVVTNGMSEFKRDKENANAAVLVNVDERDFGSMHPLAGIDFQEKLEKRAFVEGGSNYFAPVQRVKDFLKSKKSVELGKVKPSYLPGVKCGDFKNVFDKPLYEALQKGILMMDKKLRGFAMDDAVLTAVETRSSSPVRIVRDDNFEASIRGIFPIGEGAGYAGGIVSAGADGVRVVYGGALYKHCHWGRV